MITEAKVVEVVDQMVVDFVDEMTTAIFYQSAIEMVDEVVDISVCNVAGGFVDWLTGCWNSHWTLSRLRHWCMTWLRRWLLRWLK